MAGDSDVASCAHCGQPAPLRCSRCRSARFCSPRCQRLCWTSHRSHCIDATAPTAPQSRPQPSLSSAAPTSVASVAQGAVFGAGDSARAVSATGRGDEWIRMVGKDAFPGEDAGPPVRDGLEAAQRVCLERGCGGFVLWQGQAFLRARPSAELAANAQHAAAATLWLPASALASARGRASSSFALPSSLPELVVEGARPVEKRAGLSEDEMTDRFVHSKPVVLTDAQREWPAQSKWTFEWLGAKFGEEEMPVSDLAPFFQQCDRGNIQTVKVSMREYIRYILGQPNGIRSLQKSDEQVFYGNGWCPFMQHDDLLSDVSDRLYCVRDSVPRGDGPARGFNTSLTKVFLGPAGTISRLHHDTYSTHVWLSQIRGRKQFICYAPEDTEHLHCHPEDDYDGRTSLFDPSAPDFNAFPRARNARAFSVVVEEGETVVLPSRWWHWAKSLTPSITLMRNFVNEVNMKDYMQIMERAQRAKAQRK